MTEKAQGAPLLRPLITTKGLQAAVEASTLGKAVKIVQVGLTATPGEAKPEDTTLPGAAMVPVADGRLVNDHQVNVSALLPDTFQSMDICGIAFYLEDGTMFATYREPEPFLEHTAGTTLLVGMDLVMDNIPSESVIVESTGANLILGDWVPVERKVNGKVLKADIVLNAADVKALPEHGFGMGGKQGTAQLAYSFTEDGTRDFNKLLTAGEFTVDGSWINAHNNTGAAASLSGLVKVQVRRFGSGPSYTQEYEWLIGDGSDASPYLINSFRRVGTGTHPNINWGLWKPFGSWEASTGYRISIDRAGGSAYPYLTLNKRTNREDLTSGYYTIGMMEFRHDEMSDPHNPASGKLLAHMYAETLFDRSVNRVTWALRNKNNQTKSMVRLTEDFAELNAQGNSLTWNGTDLRAPGGVYVRDADLVQQVPGKAKGIPGNADLNEYTEPGFYWQASNAQAATGTNYPPRAVAGSLMVKQGAGVVQEYHCYNSSEIYTRAYYTEKWTSWERQYNTAYKPTADDVKAVPVTRKVNNKALSADITLSAADVGALDTEKGGTMKGKIIAAIMKAAIHLKDKASVSFQDAGATVYHIFANSNVLRLAHGNNGENRIMDINSGLVDSAVPVYANTALVARTGDNAKSLAMEAQASGNPYIASRAAGEASATQAIVFGKDDMSLMKTARMNAAQVRNDAGLMFSPNDDRSGTSWGMGINPTDRTLGLHKYVDGVWTALPFWVDATGVVGMNGLKVQGGADIEYLQVRSSGNPSVELHDPGKNAAMMYKPNGTSTLRFCQSNGAGGEAIGYAEISAGGVKGFARFTAEWNNNRSWNSFDHVSFWAGHREAYEGALFGVMGQRYTNQAGGYDVEMFHGFQTTNDVNGMAHVFACQGEGYLKAWTMHNSGQMTSPGGWYIAPNGDLWSPRLGANVVDWAAGSFALHAHSHDAAQGNASMVQGRHSEVGTYMFASLNLSMAGPLNPGHQVPGAYLHPAACGEWSQNRGWTFPGTWMCCGFVDANTDDRFDDRATLWFRVA